MLTERSRLRKKVNTLELEKEHLESIIKSELYKVFMNKLGESDEIKRLKLENHKLRQKINDYKKMLSKKKE